MIVIREAIAHEFEFIRRQRITAYKQYEHAVPAEHLKVLLKAISSEITVENGVEYLVAESDGAVAGSVVLFPPRTDAYEGLTGALDYPEIRMLVVDTQFRQQGIGKSLIEECINRSQKKGFPSIGLHTADFMKSAVKLYERLGFIRLPQFDFVPLDDGIVVKAYHFDLTTI
ncbi:GNAT family N-acetyltransferase [Fictibacillus sp. B-59209]|uniref:GNAT family N-acetyltransferase n=1 Tax=Fictibacillus sp. B-59209 TaxID=3024873 RepID=UPI002E1A5918|nr:GNAT family N-acetyltransferase [Fictibacillus sp. B-59209]